MDLLNYLAQDDADEIRIVSLPVLPFVVIGLWLLGGWAWGFLFGAFTGPKNPWVLATFPYELADSLGPVLGWLVPLAGLGVIALTTHRISVRVCAVERVVVYQTSWLLVIPGRRFEYEFSKVRFIDFSHVQGARRNGSFERAAMGSRGAGYYRLDIVLQDGDSIYLCSGTNRERLADLGTRIARMTNTRLG